MISIFNKCISELAFSDFNISNIEVHNVTFVDGWTVDYTKHGRSQHLLHLMLSGERIYKIDGEDKKIEGQTVLFIPHGTVYWTQSHNANGTNCMGIGILFDLTSKDGTPLNLPCGVYHKKCGNNTKTLFFEIYKAYTEMPLKYSRLKSLILELISHLAQEEKSDLYTVIRPALDLMSVTFTENLPIRAYAQACNLSESYFRKNFKAAIGISPLEYRNELRFKKAEQLYQSGSSISQIAGDVGFCDEVFFSKLYRKRFGTSIKNRLKTV